MIDAEQLERAIADDDAVGFEHDGNLHAWLAAAGIEPGAGVAAGAFAIRHAPTAIAAGRRSQLDVTRTLLSGVRCGLRIATPASQHVVTTAQLERELAVARGLLDQADGDVYAWLELAGVERNAALVALSYVLRASSRDGLAGQTHLPAWWARPEAALMFVAGLIAGLRLGTTRRSAA